jgi:hypothetical protein
VSTQGQRRSLKTGVPVMPKHFEPLQVLMFPLRLGNLLVLILFTLTFSWVEFSFRLLGVDGVILAVWLFYVSFLLFFGYLFVILDFTCRGHQQPPMLSVSLLQSAKGPLLKECVLVSFLFALVYLIDQPLWQLVTAITLLIVLPVTTSLLVIYDSLIAALNPLHWFAVMRHIGLGQRLLQYLLLSVMLAFWCFMVVSQNWGWLNPLKLWACLGSFMLVFRSFGALLHDHAEALGLDVNFSSARSTAELYKADDRQVADAMFDLHGLVNSGQLNEAALQLAAHLKANKYRREGYYFDLLMQWENQALAVRAGVAYVDRLAIAGDAARAWEILQLCFDADQGRVEVGQGTTVFMLAEFPRQAQHNQILWHLLAHFEADFPNHPRLVESLLLAARLAYVDLNDRPAAEACLAKIGRVAPQSVGTPEFKAIAQLIRS